MEEGRQFGPMRICGLSRAVEKDIYRCWDAVTPQGQPRLGFGVICCWDTVPACARLRWQKVMFLGVCLQSMPK